jgi:hypothetical protein
MKTKTNYTCDAPVPDSISKEGLARCGMNAKYFVGKFDEPVCEKCKQYLENSSNFKNETFTRIDSPNKQRSSRKS